MAFLNILADTLSSVAGTLIPPGAEPSRSTYMAGERRLWECRRCLLPGAVRQQPLLQQQLASCKRQLTAHTFALNTQ